MLPKHFQAKIIARKINFANIRGRLSFAKNLLAASKRRRAPDPIDGTSI
jgi:hypothetical protein